MTRVEDLDRFYELLYRLESKVGGKQTLKDCTGYMNWPERGVYFFFANDEFRNTSDQCRISRIGTHAISSESETSMWSRLRTHRGAKRGAYEGGGNHRGSVFRKRVGEAIIEKEGQHEEYSEWGIGSSAGQALRLEEIEMERQVSNYIRDLPFLWVAVEDTPGPESDRAYIERNAIALVSNYKKEPIDPRNDDWLGQHSPNRKIRKSGLWNVNHVEERHDSAFLTCLERYIENTDPL